MSIILTILRWLEQTPLGVMARDSFWLFPLGEILHFFGLCLLVGAMLVIDLRLLGFARRIPIAATLQLVPVAALGFALNLLSGIVFLSAYPQNYYPSTAFRIKMGVILLGGLNALFFSRIEYPRIARLSPDAAMDVRTKTIAALSLAVWFAAIVLGRLLPFVSKSSS
jgi:hypothetical protein